MGNIPELDWGLNGLLYRSWDSFQNKNCGYLKSNRKISVIQPKA
jgi:hypothetical protein